MGNDDILNYAEPVHQALLQPDIFLGIGTYPALLILIVTIVLMNTISIWLFTVGVALVLILRLVSRNDPQMLDFIFDRLMNPEIWRAS